MPQGPSKQLVNNLRGRFGRTGSDIISEPLHGLQGAGQMTLEGTGVEGTAVERLDNRGVLLSLDDIGRAGTGSQDGQDDQGEEDDVGAQGATQSHVRGRGISRAWR